MSKRTKSVKVVNEPDIYEFYRDTPPDPNDPELRSQLAMNPVLPDRGQELNISGHISADQLEEIADKSRFIENGPKGLGKYEELREMLHQKGHDIPHPRNRTYHFT